MYKLQKSNTKLKIQGKREELSKYPDLLRCFEKPHVHRTGQVSRSLIIAEFNEESHKEAVELYEKMNKLNLFVKKNWVD